jgi:energy-coupling factor transporter ATP-binding protein EcfA2
MVSTDRADELERQRANLAKRAITLEVFDGHQLSSRLKDLPKLVDDFFGRAWVAEFCGQDQAAALTSRLDAAQVADLRRRLGVFYGKVFNTNDPGLPIVTLGHAISLPLENRFVPPEILDQWRLEKPKEAEVSTPESSKDDYASRMLSTSPIETVRKSAGMTGRKESYYERRAADAWLAEGPRSIVTGGPGSGKSTLLRFIAMDLLSESPRLLPLAKKWGQFLPVWIPFPLWTKLISEPATATCSLSEALRMWLRSWDEDTLWPLISQALDDERLLLLVDGLDEWTNGDAGRIAIDRIQVFALQREIPCVASGRPHGLQRLGISETSWRVGEIADFNAAQKRLLSRIWFSYWLSSLSDDSSNRGSDLAARVEAETDTFIGELQSAPDLIQLSSVPLLLSLLISLRFQNARLPQSRFTAYEMIIQTLISTHPQRRRRAALLPFDSRSLLPDEDLKAVLATLAYYMQEEAAEGLLEAEKAQGFLEEQLVRQDGAFGFERPEARALSRTIVLTGEETIGVLVRKSPGEIGFFHRAFQEYLAAFHLSRRPLSEQAAAIDLRCVDPRWREVLLALFHFTGRSEDIEYLIKSVESRKCNPLEQLAVDELLCAIAFSDFNCPIMVARRIASRIAAEVELSFFMPHRLSLLRIMLQGLHSPRMREFVRSHLRYWFPSRLRWRESLYHAISGWPALPEVETCLWRGIQDQEPGNQRAAARAMARLKSGDPDVGDRLSNLALRAGDINTKAAAIEGLLEGWPNHGRLPDILLATRDSLAPELQLIAVLGRVRNEIHSQEDWARLVQLGSRRSSLSWSWREVVVKAFLEGWPADPRTRDVCLRATSKAMGENDLENDIAYSVLLQGYPQDRVVAQHFGDEIRREHPFLAMRFDAWRQLAENFRDNPDLVAAIDIWIQQQKFGGPEVAYGALLGRTSTAKKKLLDLLGAPFPHWTAGALLEGWGMEDPEVASALSAIVQGSARQASGIAHLLPRIIRDRVECRANLLRLLKEGSPRFDFVLEGLIALDETGQDREVVDTVFDYVLPATDTEDLLDRSVIVPLITRYSAESRVRDLAMGELDRRFGNIAAVASAYGEDAQVREKILAAACPLPTELRSLIAARLGEGVGDDETTLSLLRQYDLDEDAEVKTQASISYHLRLKVSGRDTTEALEGLSKNIVAYGLDHDERRQAAFCGLAILERLDLMIHAEEKIGEDKRCRIRVAPMPFPNIPLLRCVVEHWDSIKIALGDEVYHRLTKYSDLKDFIRAFCLLADESAPARESALELLAKEPEPLIASSTLRFVGKTRPKSSLLLDYCLKALRMDDQTADAIEEEAVMAAELLGEHFGGDPHIKRRIVSSGIQGQVYQKTILALCEGWSGDEELRRIEKTVRQLNIPLAYPTLFRLICLLAETDNVADRIVKFVMKAGTGYHGQSLLVVRPIIRRIRDDDGLWKMLAERLDSKTSPSLKGTIPRLLSVARGLPPDLENWCIRELDLQMHGENPPEIGYDLLEDALKPVAHSLLAVLKRPTIH